MKQIRPKNLRAILMATISVAIFAHAAAAQAPIPPSLVTPDKVESRLGTLEFHDGLPRKETLEKVYDNLDFSHATRAFSDTLQGVSIHALRKSLQDIGVKDNEWIEAKNTSSRL